MPPRLFYLSKSTVRRQQKKAATTLPYKHIALLAVLAIALVFVWLMQRTTSTDTAEQVILPVVSEPVSQVRNDAKASETRTTQVELPLTLNSEL